MKAFFNTQPIELTDRFVKAIQEFMLAELELMRMADSDYIFCWEYGVCEIGDLAYRNGLRYTYGSLDDFEMDDRDSYFRRPYIFVQWD